MDKEKFFSLIIFLGFTEKFNFLGGEEGSQKTIIEGKGLPKRGAWLEGGVFERGLIHQCTL